MTQPVQSRPNTRSPLSAAELAQLQDTLKRCPPATFEAAREFHRTGDRAHLAAVVQGVLERYVERNLRTKLRSRDGNLRLVEDLGLDSLTMMEIVLLAEEALRINVSNEELSTLRTVADVHAFLEEKAGSAKT